MRSLWSLRTRRWHVLITVLTVFGVVATGFGQAAYAAAAQSVQITAVTLTQSTATPYESVTADITWAADVSARSGDAATLTLPDLLGATPPTTFDLRDPNTDQIVATGAIAGGTLLSP